MTRYKTLLMRTLLVLALFGVTRQPTSAEPVDEGSCYGSIIGFEDGDDYNHCCINNFCGGSVERFFRGRKYFWTEPYEGCYTINFHNQADGCCL